ncbi:uncharacterized protein LOC115076086 [Rhinatrema bivittatum]|uniref:uncharacterized protein LOC115076086 n=1 Tax=Rhinatrema bivittatum TaxID=194408 RepID=UPI00112C7C25|nr:uncharacterized protein LOC115076086 [Rhinatrema bivittatum]
MKEFTSVATESKVMTQNVTVLQYILVSYLQIQGVRLKTLNSTGWEAMLTSELQLFLFTINQNALTFIIITDCGSLNAIVNVLNGSYDGMSDASRRDVAVWIQTQLRSPVLGSCLNSSLSMADWFGLYWQNFLASATIQEIAATNPNFSAVRFPTLSSPSFPLSPTGFIHTTPGHTLPVCFGMCKVKTLNLLSIEQRVQFIIQSDALVNVTTMDKVLTSLRSGEQKIALSTIDQFLTLLNNATTGVNWSPAVGTEVLTVLFTNLSLEFQSFSTADYKYYFQVQLNPFLQDINGSLLQLIPQGISCQSYSAVFTGFNDVFGNLSEASGNDVCNAMIAYLSSQLTPQGAGVCSELYTDSQSYIQNIFFNFSIYVSYYEFPMYYPNFQAFDVLALFTGTQLGSMMVNSSAIRNERNAVLILAELDKRSLLEVREFLIAMNSAAAQQSIEVLPDSRIEGLISETVWAKLDFRSLRTDDMVQLFGTDLQLLLSSLTPAQLATIPFSIDCTAQQALVQGLSHVYQYLDETQQKAAHDRITTYLSQQLSMSTQGVTCSSSANSSAWIMNNFGAFSQNATLEEFEALNPNFDAESALPMYTGEQLAEFTFTSEALNNETLLMEIFAYLTSTADLALYFAALNNIAQEQLQSTPYQVFILNSTFQIISQDFASFKPQDWALWFQQLLQALLPAVDGTMLSLIPVHRSCDAHQQIVIAFNDQFDNFREAMQETIYKTLIENFFNSSTSASGIICGNKTEKSQDWVDANFGLFISFADIQDLLRWNHYFDFLKVLDSVSYAQLADITLQSDALTNEDTSCQIVGRLQNASAAQTYQYLDRFYLSAQQMNISSISNDEIRGKMLLVFIGQIESQFATYSTQDWSLLLTTRLNLFLPSITADDVKLFLSTASCDEYRVIVASMNSIFPSMTPTDQMNIYQVLLSYLQTQVSATGTACERNGEGNNEWKANVLGSFAGLAQYADILSIRSSYDGMEDVASLSSSQLASLCFQNDILNNLQDVDMIMNTLESKTFDDVEVFLETFQSNALQQNFVTLTNVDVRNLVFSTVFFKLSARFSSFNISQWQDCFQNQLSYFIASINASTLQLIPNKIQCGVFQIIMESFNSRFSEMSNATQQDVCNMAKAYLLRKQQQTGSACIENTRGSTGWLQSNVASFTGCLAYQDLMTMNPDFSIVTAAENLPPALLADYTVYGDVLRDGEKAGKILAALSTDNLGEYLDEFNSAASQKGLTQLPNADVARIIIDQIYCHLSSLFPTYSTADYVQFLYRIKLFLAYSETLRCFWTEMSCQTLAALMGNFSSLASNTVLEDPTAVSSFVTETLQSQLQNSGSACAQGLTDREWIQTYYSNFIKYCQFSDFVSLKSDFQCTDCSDILSASQLASMSTQTSVIYNSSAISMVFSSSMMSGNLNDLATYMSSFNQYVLMNPALLESTKVQYTILMACANAVFPKFATMSSDNVTAWLTRMKYVLPSINGSALDLLSLDMSCTSYQALVNALNPIPKDMANKNKIDVFTFMKNYLTSKYEENGSACTSNTSGNRDWLQKNMGDYCSLANLTDIQAFKPDMDGVSYNICTLPS